MSNEKNVFLPTTVSNETKKEKKQRIKIEKKQQKLKKKMQDLKEKQETRQKTPYGTLSPGWNKFTVISTNLPSFGQGLCYIGGFLLIMTLVFYFWFGFIEPKVIVELATAYLTR